MEAIRKKDIVNVYNPTFNFSIEEFKEQIESFEDKFKDHFNYNETDFQLISTLEKPIDLVKVIIRNAEGTYNLYDKDLFKENFMIL